MAQYRAAWLLPIASPPIENGWVRTEAGRITALGRHGAHTRTAGEIDLGDVVLLPGLVNAHTHLELSWMRGKVQASDFPSWIRSLIGLQRASSPVPEVRQEAARSAIAEAQASGTVLFGDITNTLEALPALSARKAAALVFLELIGFKSERARDIVEQAATRLRAIEESGGVRCSLAAHAPYSVSPALFRAIRQAVESGRVAISSVHLAESAAELTFLERGDGPWRRLLEDVGAWDGAWVPPATGPVDYLDRLGFLSGRLLVVHGVQLDEPALAILRASGATLVTCARGNRLTGAGDPPIERFYRSGVRMAIGTDSLASVPDLNLFSEMAELRRLAPAVPAARILESATVGGARALGFEAEFGTIEPGKRDALIGVALPRGTDDVQEYLLGGIEPSRIRFPLR